ncbi:MAG: GerAB/ArcD/ProY family transporter [Christensenellales bacterium]|jgi:spore germination protein KB
MQNKKVSLNQAVFSIVLFNFGSSVIMGINTKTGQDTWLSILLATLMAIPLFLMYARILKLFPEKGLFEIAETLFGKIGGKAVSVLFIWYCIHLAALVLRNFSEFTEISALPETPQLPIMIMMVLTTVYLARSDMRAIGKWSVLAIFFVLFVVIITFVAAINQMKFDNVLPILEHSPAQIAETTFQVFAFPYAETVVFLCLGSYFPKQNNHKTMLLRALALTFIIFLLVFFRNLSLLGRKMMELSYFPSYVTVRIIEIGDFLARIEGSISSNLLLAGVTKISVCILAAARGLNSLFKLEGHRPMVLPVGMVVLALCTVLYKNTMEMFIFVDYYAYYAFPFQIVIPLVVWIAGEIHVHRQKNKQFPKPEANTLPGVQPSPQAKL